jgi:hypothetical protein
MKTTTYVLLSACLLLTFGATYAAAVPGIDACTGLVAGQCSCPPNTTSCPTGGYCTLYADQECWVGPTAQAR